jgi:hypothetical protein
MATSCCDVAPGDPTHARYGLHPAGIATATPLAIAPSLGMGNPAGPGPPACRRAASRTVA